jgi:hypothetical protein
MRITGLRSNFLTCEFCKRVYSEPNYTENFRDHSGYISFDEFKTVFSANIGPDAVPFDFDW